KFTLADEALSEIGKQSKVVGTKETGELQLLASGKLPDVVCGYERGMCVIFLPGIDGVAEIWKPDIHSAGRQWNQPRYVGRAIIPDAKQSESMLIPMEHSLEVDLVLLPMFKAVEESVSI